MPGVVYNEGQLAAVNWHDNGNGAAGQEMKRRLKMEENQNIRQEIAECEKLLIGLGEEWKAELVPDIANVYEKLAELTEGRDFFIVTTVTDARIFESGIDASRIVAPCGNDTWRQCSRSCTKDIWEPGEIPDDICPHCGAPLTGNTIKAETYIEEGYLPQWNKYTAWLAGTLNKRLVILELGVGFAVPTVIRWPFEKTAALNKKAHMYRIHGKFAQLSAEMGETAVSVPVNSVEYFRNLYFNF